MWDLLLLPYPQSLIHWRAEWDCISLFCSCGIHIDKTHLPVSFYALRKHSDYSAVLLFLGVKSFDILLVLFDLWAAPSV